MTSDWKTVSLGDLIDVLHGYAFPGESITDEPGEQILVTPGNFAIGGGFQVGKGKYFVGPVPPGFVLSPGDLVVTMTDLSKQSDTLGYPALVPEVRGARYLHNQRIGKVVLRPGANADLRFLYFLLCSGPYRHEVLASATGTGVKHTAPKRICSYRFSLPSLSEQHAISSVLGTLNDKIDVNRRMNQTLEDMAQALFRSWFVDFDPVRKKTEGRAPEGMDTGTAALFPDQVAASELGPIPEGWRVSPLGDFIRNVRRQVDPSELPVETPYIGLEHMPRGSICLDTWETASKVTSGKLAFSEGQILFGRLRPYFKKVGVALVDGVCSSDILIIEPKIGSDMGWVLGHLTRQEFIDYTAKVSGGTRMPRVSWEDVARYPVAVPPSGHLPALFESLTSVLRARMKVTANESNSLSSLRDLLLPKLLSGEIRVSDAEDQLAVSA